jgi:hypothetical protein
MSDVEASDHPDFIGGIVWSPSELRWINGRLAALKAQVKELVEINLTTEDQRANLKRRLCDAELSLHVFDPGAASEYWLKYSGPTPDADSGSQS